MTALTWWATKVRQPMVAAVDGVGCLTILGRASDGVLVELAVIGNVPGLDAIAWRAHTGARLRPLGLRLQGGWKRGRCPWGGIEWTAPAGQRVGRVAA